MPEDRSPRRRPEKKTTQRPTTRNPGRWRLLLPLLPILSVALGTYLFLRSPWLTVQYVDVVGAQTLDTTALIDLTDLDGRSMLRLPVAEARKRVLEIPQVKSASFRRDWPQRVTLRIEERVPAAFWAVGGRDYVVDSEGVVLAAGAPAGPAPRIVEPDSERVMGPGDRVHPDAIALAYRIQEESPRFLGQSVKELEYRPAVGVTAVFGNGLRVTFGDERSYEYKVAVLGQLLDQLSARGVSPRAVDLRFGERVTYE